MIGRIELGEIEVEIVQKDIKNVHLSVHPPTGRVRISAPLRMDLAAIRLFAIAKLGWIKQQQRKFQSQERETAREYLDRESHYVWGNYSIREGAQVQPLDPLIFETPKRVIKIKPVDIDADRRHACS